MCDIIDLDACRQKEQEKNQDDAASLGFIQGGEFSGFFNVETGERLLWGDEDEAKILDFSSSPKEDEDK